MSGLLAIARSGVAAVLLHRLRSAATVASIVALLVPFIAGLAVSRGLSDEAAAAARAGADIVVTGLRYGRAVPVPLAAADTIRALPDVVSVHPRVVGTMQMGAQRESVVVVGVDADDTPREIASVEGRLFAPGAANELVVGSRLASRLALAPGSRIPPFYENREAERVSQVVGVFRSELPMWEANLVFTSLETAQALFDERGTATQLLVTCREGYTDAVRKAIANLQSLAPKDAADPLRARARTRADVEGILARGAASSEGIFALHFALLFAAAIPLLLVTSGAGLRERRREVGILKMLGWGTDDVLLRGFAESFVLATLGASLSILLVAAWLGPLGARGIGAVLLPGADADPSFGVPWRLTPGPVVMAAGLSLVLVLVGTLPSSWRAASAEPMESMR